MSRKVKNAILAGVFAIALVANVFTVENVNKNMESFGGSPTMEGTNKPIEPGTGELPEGGGGNPPDVDTNRPMDGERDEESRSELREETMPNRTERGVRKETNVGNYVLIVLEVGVMGGCVVYAIMSGFNKKSWSETVKNGDKVAILVLGVATFTLSVVGCEVLVVGNYDMHGFKMEDSSEKETKREDIDSGELVEGEDIDLSRYDSNITISKAGVYNLSGKFSHIVLIDADGDVTLNLDGVEIANEISAAIANVGEHDLTINLVEGTENKLEDGGSSEYDACVYSVGKLIIEGEGLLEVYGKQEEGEGIATENNDIVIRGGNIYIESVDDGINAGGDGGTITIEDGNIYIKASGDGIDSNKDLAIKGGTVYTMGSSRGGDAGIDTDEGFTIDGGIIVALGSDMLEAPMKSSRQNSICFTLGTMVSKGTLVSLVSKDEDEVVSFKADENFKTLIVSSDKLKEGSYYLYTGGSHSGVLENSIYEGGEYNFGEKMSVGGITEFTLSGKVTNIK